MTANKISTTHSKIILCAFPLGVDRIYVDEAWEDTQAKVAKATAAQSPVKETGKELQTRRSKPTSLLRPYSLNTPCPDHLLCHLGTILMVNAELRPSETSAVLEPPNMKPQLEIHVKNPTEHDELWLVPA